MSYSLNREKVAEHSFLRSLRSFVASFLLSFVPSFNFLVSQLTVKIFILYPNYSLGDNNISSKMRTRHYQRHLWAFPSGATGQPKSSQTYFQRIARQASGQDAFYEPLHCLFPNCTLKCLILHFPLIEPNKQTLIPYFENPHLREKRICFHQCDRISSAKFLGSKR